MRNNLTVNGPSSGSYSQPVQAAQQTSLGIDKHTNDSKNFRFKKMIVLGAAVLAGLSICSVAVINQSNYSSKSTVTSVPVEAKVVHSAPSIAALNEKEKQLRKDWSKYITASYTNYAYGVLGGINNLSVIFSNKTDYPLEEVTAKISYIKANGKPWKVKYVSVFNVQPHSQRKQALTKVNRGKSVEVTIHKIVSKKMQFRYEAGKKQGNKEDPYFAQ